MASKLNTGGDDDIVAEINVTPLVDVMLVLLIIFMVTSSYIAKAAVEVNLPKAASGGEAVESTLNIIITKEGKLLLNGEDSDLARIATYIKAEVKQNPKLQAVIAADTGVEYGEVMKVIDTIKQNGVKSFALNIEKKTQEAP
jgi:biopolymer transport protein ExbD